MDAELMSWKNEMENMLAAINRQTTNSLRVIKLIFKRCGRSLPPDFKQYFLQTSSHSIKTTYEQFEIDSLLEDPLDVNLNSLANVAEETLDDGQRELSFEARNEENEIIQIDDLDDEEGILEAVKTEPTLFFEPLAIHGINESIAFQSNTNESYTIDAEDSIVTNFAVDTDEPNDSIDLVENQNELIDVEYDEVTPMDTIVNGLYEAAIAESIEDKRKSIHKNKTTSLNHKNSSRKRMKKTKGTNKDQEDMTKEMDGKKSRSKQSKKTKKRFTCSFCEYVANHMGLINRHMRTHTGEKPLQCNRCGKRFTRTASLTKHAASHIGDLPSHCRACFRGFLSKAEAVDHEKQCQTRHYECYLCNLIATDKYDLKTHMRKHNGDKPFRCRICMKHFFQKPNLKKHLNTVHA